LGCQEKGAGIRKRVRGQGARFKGFMCGDDFMVFTFFFRGDPNVGTFLTRNFISINPKGFYEVGSV
jgi:hypothetical protein